MRVIAGELKRRRLKAVDGLLVRPTPDRLRETLFNVLALQLPGKSFVDAYAGTGAVGIEAFSRGASRVVLIERSPQAIAVIHENLSSLGIAAKVTIARGAVARLLPKYDCDIVFLDPPYDRPKEYVEAFQALAGMQCPLVIAQHPSRMALDDSYGSLHKKRVLKQGDNSLTFFERATEY